MDTLLQQMSFSGDDAMYDVILSLMTIPCSLCSTSGHSLSDDDPIESIPSVVILCLMTIPWSLFHQWSFSDDPIRILSSNRGNQSNNDPMESLLL